MFIGTFNVRGLKSNIKQTNLFNDAVNYGCDIIALQETKIQSIDVRFDSHRLITFNSANTHYGLGFIISNNVNLHSKLSVNDRIAFIRFEVNSKFYTLFNVYAPHSALTKKDPKVREEFYNELSDSYNSRKTKGDTILICGDFNSKVGKIIDDSERECLGSFSKGTRNNNGTELLNFCIERNLFISNSAFKHKSCHQTTWQGQIKKDNKIIQVYNQIDFILIPKHMKKNLTDARSFGGTLTNSDHRLVKANINFHGKPYRKPPLPKKPVKFHTNSLQNERVRAEFRACAEHLHQSRTHLPSTPQATLDNINATLLEAAQETLPPVDRRHGKHFCPEIEELSRRQKEIRLLINNSNNDETSKSLKTERNKILNQIKTKSLENANNRIDNLVEEIENCSPGSAQMYQAVKAIFRKPPKPITVKNEEGALVENDAEKVNILQEYFTKKYTGKATDPFTKQGELNNPITPDEVGKAIAKLSNNKAPGPDGVQVELLKSAPFLVIVELAEAFNDTFIQGQHTNIGEGTLILLQKPGKPVGPPANLRPIVLLPAARKILSLIALDRIRDKVEAFLSPSQAGFRQNRGTADIVWSHKWLISKVERVKDEFTILGIDMSSAFDTIDRSKLIEVCATFLDEDEVRIIRALLSNTSLKLHCGAHSQTIPTLVGSPQGDGLSPTLFVVYLEAALRDVRAALEIVTPRNLSELAYADDVDFIFNQLTEAESNHDTIADTLATWNLLVNKSKTEISTIRRTSENWKETKKLGSLLDTDKDIERRKSLATIAFRKMYTIWVRRKKIAEERLIRLYKALIIPIILYNCGTWATTKLTFEKLDTFHRKQLRSLLGIKWSDKVTNDELYRKCNSQPLTLHIARARWKLFGHILRRPEDIPANRAMQAYFEPNSKPCYRGKAPTNLPQLLDEDLRKSATITLHHQDHSYHRKLQLKTKKDLDHLKELAQNRDNWDILIQRIVGGRQAETRQPPNKLKNYHSYQ